MNNSSLFILVVSLAGYQAALDEFVGNEKLSASREIASTSTSGFLSGLKMSSFSRLTAMLGNGSSDYTEAENYSYNSGSQQEGVAMGHLDDGDYLQYASFDFGSGKSTFEAVIAVDPQYAGQIIELRIDGPNGRKIGELQVQNTGGWHQYVTQFASIETTSGVHDLYLLAKGHYGIGNIDKFRFNQVDPNPIPSQGVQVLTLANPILKVIAGQTLTLTTRFQAQPLAKNYVVFVHFVDSAGVNRLGGADFSPSIATSLWNGFVSFNRSVQIPSTAEPGTYLIRIGLYEPLPPNWSRVAMQAGADVIAESDLRFTVGRLIVEAPANQGPTGGGSIPRPGSLTGLTPSGPIRLESNRTYSGLRITNPNGRCIVGQGVTNVRITNSEIGPCGNGSDSEHLGIGIYDSSNIRVDHNIIHDVATGLDAVRSTGVVFTHNYVYGIRGPFPSGQIVQYENVHGAGNKIMCNIGANTDNDTTEDSINMWMSRGTPDSYIEVAYNRVRGGHSKTGSGIILGDGEGSAYIDVHDNTVVNANNAGIGVAGGRNMRVRNNRIYNNGRYSSVGLSVRNWYSACSNIEVTNNRVWAFDHVWGMNSEWHYLNTGECSNVQASGNAIGDTSLNPAIFDQHYSQCD